MTLNWCMGGPQEQTEHNLGMKWTTEAPTEPGYYWVCFNSDKHIDLFFVTESLEVDKQEITAWMFAKTSPWEYVSLEFLPIDVHWLGPIPEPKPPT